MANTLCKTAEEEREFKKASVGGCQRKSEACRLGLSTVIYCPPHYIHVIFLIDLFQISKETISYILNNHKT